MILSKNNVKNVTVVHASIFQILIYVYILFNIYIYLSKVLSAFGLRLGAWDRLKSSLLP